MALLFSATEATVRAALRVDVRAAWNVTRIYDDAPALETAPGELPSAYIALGDPSPLEDWSSVRHTAILLPYTITLRAPKPVAAPGVSLHTAKSGAAEALRMRLVSGETYAGFNREWQGDVYAAPDADSEAVENFYSVAVRFDVIVLVEAI